MKNHSEVKISKKVRAGDQVFVITGNYKGQTGKVLRKTGQYLTIQGINVRKKCVKKSQTNPKGAILEIEKPIHISNVQLCIEEKPVRAKIGKDKNGNRMICYRDGEKQTVYREFKKVASKS